MSHKNLATCLNDPLLIYCFPPSLVYLFFLQAGLATFPNDPLLNIVFANFLLEVSHDEPASRSQIIVSS